MTCLPERSRMIHRCLLPPATAFAPAMAKSIPTTWQIAFATGSTTETTPSIARRGLTHEQSNGNGSLMRIAPLALTDATDQQIAEVSAITHAHPISTTACIVFVHILRKVMHEVDLPAAIHNTIPDNEQFAFLADIENKSRDEIQSTGFVLHTLEAALWCNLNTESYTECVREAVNLGSDTDTTACVAGALAGVIYGYNAIPEQWLKTLRGKDIIDACLFKTE